MKQVDQDHGPKLVGTDQETRSQLSHEIGNPPSPDASNNKSKSWWERDEVVWPILAGVIGISFVVGMIQGKTTYVLLRVVKYVVLFAAIPGLGLLTQRYPALSSIGKSLMFFMLALVALFHNLDLVLRRLRIKKHKAEFWRRRPESLLSCRK
ncbi:MAG: hypothetical protein R3E58_01315 [Phycisphaerae bacterium]